MKNVYIKLSTTNKIDAVTLLLYCLVINAVLLFDNDSL